MQFWKINFWLLIFVSFQLVACANTQVASTKAIQKQSIKEAEVAIKSSITPEQSISKAENQLKEAQTAKLDFFAPLHILQAKESISDAKEYLNKPPKGIKNAALMAAIAAQTFISRAYKNKINVEGNLKKVLAHKHILEELNTPQELPEDYQDLVSELTGLIKLIETGKVSEAISDQDALLDTMAEVEIKTLILQHLTPAVEFLEKAEDISADDYAELSFEKAEKTLEASDDFIQANYRDRKGVTRVGLEALRAAKKAYFIALEAKKRVKMNPEEAEEHILELVSMQNNLYRKIKGHNLEPQSLSSAQEILLRMVDDLKQQLELSEITKTEQELPSKKVQNKIKPALEGLHIFEMTQDEEITVIKTLPEDNQPDEKSQDSLQEDEQLFDSVENMQTLEQ